MEVLIWTPDGSGRPGPWQIHPDHPYAQWARQQVHLADVKRPSSRPVALQGASLVRAASVRRRALSLAKAISLGFGALPHGRQL